MIKKIILMLIISTFCFFLVSCGEEKKVYDSDLEKFTLKDK